MVWLLLESWWVINHYWLWLTMFGHIHFRKKVFWATFTPGTVDAPEFVSLTRCTAWILCSPSSYKWRKFKLGVFTSTFRTKPPTIMIGYLSVYVYIHVTVQFDFHLKPAFICQVCSFSHWVSQDADRQVYWTKGARQTQLEKSLVRSIYTQPSTGYNYTLQMPWFDILTGPHRCIY